MEQGKSSNLRKNEIIADDADRAPVCCAPPVSQYLFEKQIVCPDCFKEEQFMTITALPILQLFTKQSATSTEIESNIEEKEGSWYSDDFGSSSTSEMDKRKLEKSRRLGVEFEGQLKNLTHLLHIITEVGIAELLRDSTKKEDHIVLRIINKMKMIKEAPQFATVVIDNALKRELVEEMTRSWTWLSARGHQRGDQVAQLRINQCAEKNIDLLNVIVVTKETVTPIDTIASTNCGPSTQNEE
ncbi:hypothetical protein GCK72_015676 [Caenorhabditis remanei]|uniref:Uncharacterized protein n=1 Tax=Caenorhabditis remanei TaxID=31234 RepID=A0A6A5GXG8_CAERE|nr:hypothetical protein GCK72_015676 [Caenorhabditis remanei]KAF1759215.1 hypothetical protein GCK72_015676 [Caenorhabditis remanei]